MLQFYENYSDLVKSLHTILALAPRVLYPGHGAVVMDTVKYVQAYIDHRQMREQQIVDTLKSGQQASYTVEDIVANIYEVWIWYYDIRELVSLVTGTGITEVSYRRYH